MVCFSVYLYLMKDQRITKEFVFSLQTTDLPPFANNNSIATIYLYLTRHSKGGGDTKRKDKFHSPIKVLDQMGLSRGQVTNALNSEVATFT